MKRRLLYFIPGYMLLLGNAAIAQPTLTATGINPVIGESYTINNGNYVSEGSSGANQTWDLSTISGSSGGLTNNVTPSSTPNGSNFPTSNLAADNTTTGSTGYYFTSSSVLQILGAVGGSGSTVITYSNYEDILHFPFNYNNSYNDQWAASFQSAGYNYYRTGNTTVTADGYGTLITPNGTYTNVMRVHFVQDYQDSTYIGTPYIITYYNDEYIWYKEGVHATLAAVYTFTNSMSGTSTAGFYLTGTIGIDETNNYITSSNVFPNPAVDKVNINLNLTEKKRNKLFSYSIHLDKKWILSKWLMDFKVQIL